MTADPGSPYDNYFREVMSRPEDAASEVRAALPAEITKWIDFQHFDPMPTSFVSAELQPRVSDVLYRTRCRGRDAFVYILIEHQSRPDELMPLRMLEYLVAIWNQYRKDHPNATTLPITIPLVVHSGPKLRQWNKPTTLAELFDLDPAVQQDMAPYLPQFEFLLDDIAPLELEALRERNLTPNTMTMLLLHKIIKDPNLPSIILDWTDTLNALLDEHDGAEKFNTSLYFLFRNSDIILDQLNPLQNKLGPRGKEAIVTTAERLEARGEIKTLLLILQTRRIALTTAERERITTCTDTTQLETWVTRAITATIAADIFD